MSNFRHNITYVRQSLAQTPRIRSDNTSETNAHLRSILQYIDTHGFPDFYRKMLRRDVAIKRRTLRDAYDTYRKLFGTSLAATQASRRAIIDSARANLVARRMSRLPSPPHNHIYARMIENQMAALPPAPTHVIQQ